MIRRKFFSLLLLVVTLLISCANGSSSMRNEELWRNHTKLGRNNIETNLISNGMENQTRRLEPNQKTSRRAQNEKQQQRSKRDACDVTGALEITEKSIDMADTLVNVGVAAAAGGAGGGKGGGGGGGSRGSSGAGVWSHIKNIASSAVSLAKSIFSFQSPTTCDLDRKLDKILDLQNKIVESINDVKKSMIQLFENLHQTIDRQFVALTLKIDEKLNWQECENIKRDQKNTLVSLTKRLATALMNHVKLEGYMRADNRENVLKLCIDPTEGIEKILTNFASILEEQTIEANLEACSGDYKRFYAQIWSRQIRALAFNILFILSECEEVNGLRTVGFDRYEFMEHVNDILKFTLDYKLNKRRRYNLNSTINFKGIVFPIRTHAYNISIVGKHYASFQTISHETCWHRCRNATDCTISLSSQTSKKSSSVSNKFNCFLYNDFDDVKLSSESNLAYSKKALTRQYMHKNVRLIANKYTLKKNIRSLDSCWQACVKQFGEFGCASVSLKDVECYMFHKNDMLNETLYFDMVKDFLNNQTNITARSIKTFLDKLVFGMNNWQSLSQLVNNAGDDADFSDSVQFLKTIAQKVDDDFYTRLVYNLIWNAIAQSNVSSAAYPVKEIGWFTLSTTATLRPHIKMDELTNLYTLFNLHLYGINRTINTNVLSEEACWMHCVYEATCVACVFNKTTSKCVLFDQIDYYKKWPNTSTILTFSSFRIQPHEYKNLRIKIAPYMLTSTCLQVITKSDVNDCWTECIQEPECVGITHEEDETNQTCSLHSSMVDFEKVNSSTTTTTITTYTMSEHSFSIPNKYVNLRLANPYDSFSGQVRGHYECWEHCFYHEPVCVASMYEERHKTCHLFDKFVNAKRDVSGGYDSYSSLLLKPTIVPNMICDGGRVEPAAKGDHECWRYCLVNDTSCIGSSFHNMVCHLYSQIYSCRRSHSNHASFYAIDASIFGYKLFNVHYLTPYLVSIRTSFEDCWRACLFEPRCIGIHFIESFHNCEFHESTQTTFVYTNSYILYLLDSNHYQIDSYRADCCSKHNTHCCCLNMSAHQVFLKFRGRKRDVTCGNKLNCDLGWKC